jgi:predicted phage terminase large subunit-like protein
MKSLSTNVFWPAWEWGPQNNPELRFISASYSKELTLRDNRRCRQLIGDERYQQFWGDRFEIAGDQDAKGKFENNHRGWKLATSVGGHVVGERGDRFIIDDPHNIKTAESNAIRESTLQWFTEVVPTRVNDPDEATFVIIMQRVHERDVSGLILANDLGYEYLCLPMEYEDDHPAPCRNSIGFTDWRTTPGELLWPERFSQRSVIELKTQLQSWGGIYAEAGQLQQRPSPRGGGMFQKEWWRFYKTDATGFNLASRPNGCDDSSAVPLPTDFDWVHLTCDAAFKDSKKSSRVSLLVVAGKGPFRFILDNVTDHMSFNETCKAILEVDEHTKKPIGGLLVKWPKIAKVLIEDKANGPAIINLLRQFVSGIIPINPQGGKESRASAMEPAIQSGHVLLPDGAPWLVDFVGELAAFPAGKHDDQVDALSQVMTYMTADEDIARAMNMAKW